VTSYQVLPPLTDAERESLADNIKARGVLQPVVVDEDGNVIDGHHRAQICVDLGIEYPTTVLAGLSEDDKIEQALVLNLGRRHLTPEQKADLVRRLSADGRTIRWIAKTTGISKSAVQRYLSPGVPDGTPDVVLPQHAINTDKLLQRGVEEERRLRAELAKVKAERDHVAAYLTIEQIISLDERCRGALDYSLACADIERNAPPQLNRLAATIAEAQRHHGVLLVVAAQELREHSVAADSTDDEIAAALAVIENETGLPPEELFADQSTGEARDDAVNYVRGMLEASAP
jgi:ParB-like chromosome segregation protein Spo0J